MSPSIIKFEASYDDFQVPATNQIMKNKKKYPNLMLALEYFNENYNYIKKRAMQIDLLINKSIKEIY